MKVANCKLLLDHFRQMFTGYLANIARTTSDALSKHKVGVFLHKNEGCFESGIFRYFLPRYQVCFIKCSDTSSRMNPGKFYHIADLF